MERALAKQLLERGEKLCYVWNVRGALFMCKFPYDAEFGQKLYTIPSWKSMYKKDPTGQRKKGIFLGFKVHYLDLPTLEGIAYESGYQVEHENRDVLRHLKTEYLERREWKKKKFLDIQCKRPLDDIQMLGAQFMYRSKRALNADGMGVGKTAETLGAILLNKMDGKPYRTLVVCPTTAKGGWRKETQIVTDLQPFVLDSNMDKRYEQYDLMEGYDIFISSFDSFISDWEEMAARIKPDIIVIDECHRLCNKDNRITQALIGGKNIKKTFMDVAKPHAVYLMTGTPISNRMEDLYPLLKLMDPDILNWTGFRNRYCLLEEGERWVHRFDPITKKKKASKQPYFTVVGYQNEKELKGKLSLHMIRRTKDEALPDLPPKTFLPPIEIELSPEERKYYDELKEHFETYIRGKKLIAKNTLSWMTRAQQICNSLETLPDSTAKKSSKLEVLLRILDAHAKKRKIVVFSTSEKMIRIIKRETKMYKPVVLTGSYTGDRQELVDQFQEDPSRRLFLSTLKAGGIAITLHAANLCILYNRWWAPAANDQGVDRLHRRGQTSPVDIMTLRVRNSIEEHLDRVWANKALMIDDTIGVEKSIKKMTKEQLESLL